MNYLTQFFGNKEAHNNCWPCVWFCSHCCVFQPTEPFHICRVLGHSLVKEQAVSCWRVEDWALRSNWLCDWALLSSQLADQGLHPESQCHSGEYCYCFDVMLTLSSTIHPIK